MCTMMPAYEGCHPFDHHFSRMARDAYWHGGCRPFNHFNKMKRMFREHCTASQFREDNGWELVVPVPGFSSKDVTVEISASGELHVHALPLLEEKIQLPSGADISAARASVIDGVLRVAVPRKKKEKTEIPVANEHAADDEAKYIRKLLVPGWAAKDVKVQGWNTTLFVQVGSSDALSLRLPADAQCSAAVASVADGVLKVQVPKAPPAQVPVNSSEPQAAGAEEILHLNIPGVPASEVSVEVTGKELRVSVRGYQSREVLPAGTLLDSLRAQVADGVLTVSAAREEGAARVLDVSSTTPAKLPTSSAQPAGEVHDAEGADEEAAADPRGEEWEPLEP